MSLKSKLRDARARYRKSHSNRALYAYLRAKAAAGIWDSRYCGYFHVPLPSNKSVRRFIMRGYVAGLVPTATTNGTHAPGSLHYQKRAADLGLRGPEINTARGIAKMRRFQSKEFARRGRYHHTELIGPINNQIVLRGHATALAEHSDLEDAHDNHVHGGF